VKHGGLKIGSHSFKTNCTALIDLQHNDSILAYKGNCDFLITFHEMFGLTVYSPSWEVFQDAGFSLG